jgi:hypothetical protein
MTWRRFLRAVLGLYPRPWRDRYRAEATAVVHRLLGRPDPQPARLGADLFWGAIKERSRPSIRRPQAGIMASFVPPALRHRDALLRRTLDRRAQALLEPGEQLMATFGAATSHPRRAVLRRSPVESPRIVERGVVWRFVVIGGEEVWIGRRADRITTWMTSARES